MQHKDRHVQSRAIISKLFEPEIAPTTGPTNSAGVAGWVGRPEVPSGMSLSTMAAIMGRAGGLKGGPARAEALSPKRRSEIAKMAAQKRWGARG